MGAGKGKSRVAAALAYYYLTNTKKQVYVVFADEGLKKRDETECEFLWAYAKILHQNEFERLHYWNGLQEIKRKKDSIFIIDESDAIIMRDPVDFA